MPETTVKRCALCGEVMPLFHDCGNAREARSLFEAAKRANNRESALHLANSAYATAQVAEAAP